MEEWKQEDFKPTITIIKRDNLENLHELKEQLSGFDIFISSLGARTKDGEKLFTHIEKEVPTAFAQLGKECGVKYFSYLSGMMVNPKSRIMMLRVKGQTELAIFE